MTFQEERRFSFVSNAVADDTFAVVRFTGMEAISQPYRFEITLAAEEPEIDLSAMLQNTARLIIHRHDQDERVFHGILAEFQQMEESGSYNLYKAVLVPRLWNAGLYRQNQLFQDKSVPDIIEAILKQIRLTSQDYALRLTKKDDYPKWEYICQWQESALNFISRWMEREGIYYYFAQEEQGEKLIITNNATSHENIPADHLIPYSPPSSLAPRDQELIQTIVCSQRRLPNRVLLRDYNYRRPSLDLRAEAIVDSEATGDVYIYGEHFKETDEGNLLARIRAEELLCRRLIYHGESTAANLWAGFLFNLEDHFRTTHNQQYLITEVEHHGFQAMHSLSGQHKSVSKGEGEREYHNRFSAIPAGVQFRPERNATRPRFYGTLNAVIDAAGNGQYAELDDQGRYKVILPFDESDNDGGRASRWVRMAQPYAGNNYGMHFPLHRGTEVLLTFIDGDPDRPIIAASVPNPDTASPVISDNQSQCMIRTGGNNQIHTEDKDGSQQIVLHSPVEKSRLRLGKDDDQGESGISMSTDGDETVGVEKNRIVKISGNDNLTVKKNRKVLVEQDEELKVEGKREKTITGKEINYCDGGQDSFIKNKRILQVLSGGEEYTVNGGQTQTINAKQEVTVNGPQTITATGLQTINAKSGRIAFIKGAESYEVTGDRTIKIGSETRSIGSENGMNFVSDNKMNYGFKNELFMGQKGDYNFALALEFFTGIKMALGSSLTLQHCPGIKIGREALTLQEARAKIQDEGMSIRRGRIWMFVG
jgi:type VI secretion system secreted protein VgrG